VRFLADHWDDSGPAPSAVTEIIAYYLTPPVAGVSELHRIKCSGSTAPALPVPTLAHYVYNGPVPSDPADPRRPPAVVCSTSCGAAAVPDRVTLTFWSTKPSAYPDEPPASYEIILTGQRRQS
jgi:hypothetical protein